jgi:DNA-binding response OmpR family regulator
VTYRLLVVDDEPDMRTLIRLALGSDRFEVVEAGTGEAALDRVKAERFDLVLLDLNLPGIDGLQVLERWANEGTVPGLPVLMLTADTRFKERSLELGCRDYLTKPMAPQELVRRIEEELGPDVSAATVGGT